MADKPASGVYLDEWTPDVQAVYDDYCTALGAFIDRFSEVERMLNLLLRRYVRVSDGTGRALFASMRVGELKDAINRVLDAASDWTAKASLEPFFNQLGMISSLRNNIVHWGGYQLNTGEFLVSNVPLATLDRVRGHRINAQDLRDLAGDLKDISQAIRIAMTRTNRLMRRIVLPPAPGPWRYTPRPLPLLETNRRSKPPPTRSRQRGASKTKRPKNPKDS